MKPSDVPISRVQEYWDARPCNIRHSPKIVGTLAYWDDVELRKYFVEPHIPGFAQFERWKGKRVLELGCGIGTDTINFARAGAQVTAVDISVESLSLAQQRAFKYQLGDHIDFERGNIEAWLPRRAPRQFDLIYAFGVLHHTPNPVAALRLARHFLAAEGGTLKIMLYHRRSWKQFFRQQVEAQAGCPVAYTYSKREARDLVERCGFKVEHLEVTHIFPYRVKDYLDYRYVKEWWFRLMPSWMFRWLEPRFGWHILITARAV